MALRFVSAPDSSDKATRRAEANKINHGFFVDSGSRSHISEMICIRTVVNQSGFHLFLLFLMFKISYN